jgi:hypothetical protein
LVDAVNILHHALIPRFCEEPILWSSAFAADVERGNSFSLHLLEQRFTRVAAILSSTFAGKALDKEQTS